MAYEVHITRKVNWFDEEGPSITLEDWRLYAIEDKDLKLDALPEQSGDQSTLRMESPGSALWATRKAQGKGQVWFRHFRDRVTVRDPDVETLMKMYKMAGKLGGKVQGNDGEFYAADGSSNRKAKPATAAKEAAPEKKPWWKLGG
jgi:hypothetical protein